ncbi:MAG: DUF1059 domain-containing protein [bacterium]|nr:MAG: DUF1059 domain-containing protein [bacterium]
MGKTVSCKDLGSISCTWQGRAETEEELVQLAMAHGREAHGMTEFPPELMNELRTAIKDE